MKKIIIIFIIAVAIVRCNSASAIDRENKLPGLAGQSRQSNENNIIEFKINGQLIKTSGWNIRRFQFDGNSSEWLNITTNMHDEQRTINVNLNGTVPGKYIVDEADPASPSHGAFFPDYIEDIANSYSFTRAVFEITRVDTAKGVVDGFFSGKARNQHGETLEITDGKIINGLLKPGVTRY